MNLFLTVICSMEVHIRITATWVQTPKLSSLDVHETDRAETSNLALGSTAAQQLPGSISLRGFTDCLTPWNKDALWVMVV